VGTVGLISDTHGLLRDGALDALRGSDLIIHAGDVGREDILNALRQLAPTVAIRGNIDRAAWASALPATAVAETVNGLIYVLHDVNQLAVEPGAAGFRMVVSGHSHKPSQKVLRGVIYVNPGSAGPRRFHLPVTVARIDLGENSWTVTFVDVLTGAVVNF
jgi:putative phosphoesterase